MKLLRRLILFPLLVLTGFYFGGCSDSTSTEVTASEITEEEYITQAYEEDLNLLKDSGIPVDEYQGVFSVGWHQFFRPYLNEEDLVGNSFAAVFDSGYTSRPPFLPQGIDVGNVIINYSTNSVTLNKIFTPEGGVFYSMLAWAPLPIGQNLEFIPETEYEFEVTGSTEFDSLRFSVISPAQLISLTNLNDGQIIDPADDLTIMWEGGTDSTTVITISPFYWPPEGIGAAIKPGDAGPPPPGHKYFENGIVIILDGNPGQYTVSGEAISELIANTGAGMISCNVGQMNPVPFEHDGKNYMSLMRNGDRVLLDVE
ncbi:MAG: hypothetical protein Kow0098_14710 [Ignavibacteriaceae bacterium]